MLILNQETMNTHGCLVHGETLHTAPNRNGLSFCLKCVAVGMKKKPGDFYLTDDFKKLVQYHAT